MYAIVEFAKRACSLVSLQWLRDGDSKCLWPPVTTDRGLEKLLQRHALPKASWKLCEIIKILKLCDKYEEGEVELQKILDESASDVTSDSNNVTEPLTKKPLENSDDNFTTDSESEVQKSPKEGNNKLPTGKISAKQTKHKSQDTDGESSGSFSDDSYNVSHNKKIKIIKDLKLKIPGSPGTQLKKHPLNQRISQHERIEEQVFPNPRSQDSPQLIFQSSSQTTPQRSPQLTPTSGQSSNPVRTENFETILRHLVRIDQTQIQQTIALENILGILHSQNAASLSRPDNMPNLPVSSKKDYKALEEFLRVEENFNYLKSRLAAVGGSTVRDTTMNILKFIITNEVAMKFNWAGRDKRPFKKTRMAIVVCDAVKLAFAGRPSEDLSDKNVQDAIKSWLKLAKSRYLYNTQKKNE